MTFLFVFGLLFLAGLLWLVFPQRLLTRNDLRARMRPGYDPKSAQLREDGWRD